MDNNNESNGKEESSKENKGSKQEKSILKIDTKNKKTQPKATPPADKYIGTDKIDPKYVEQLEEENQKLKTHAVMIMTKFGEVVQFVANTRQFMSESGFEMQAKARENMDILNIRDKNYDSNWLMGLIKEEIAKANPK